MQKLISYHFYRVEDNMKISAVVPTYNNEDVIEECIESLLNQTRKFDEIIVVDDGSTDKTPEIIKRLPVKIIRAKHSERSHARNVGWKNTTGDFISIIESDSVYDRNWLENIMKKLKNGAYIVNDTRRVYNPQTFFSKMEDEILKVRQQRGRYKPFAGWTFKKEVLEKIGGYDENITGPEDVELGYRLIKKGYKISQAFDAIQYHKGEPKSFGDLLKRAWWFGTHVQEYYKKHPRKIPLLTLGLFSLITLLIFVPQILVACLIIIYFIFLVRAFYNGLSLKYIFISPLVSISWNWIFTIGVYYGFIKRLL